MELGDRATVSPTELLFSSGWDIARKTFGATPTPHSVDCDVAVADITVGRPRRTRRRRRVAC